MFSPIRNRFGIPGVISVIALVFAMFGGAYAASNGGDGKATASAKAKAGPRGPRGKTGPVGPAGPAGQAGAKGDTGAASANGKDGTNGANGKDGTNGTNGVSVTTSAASGAECPSGGIKVTSASPPAKVCNGTTGFTETLPSGKTETGAWAATRGTEGDVTSPISFPIPLEETPEMFVVSLTFEEDPGEVYELSEVEKILEDGAEHGCPGFTASGVPRAAPGKLCVYGSFELNMHPSPTSGATLENSVHFTEKKIYKGGGEAPNLSNLGSGVLHGVGPAGTVLLMNCKSFCEGQGAWAVTAE